MHANGLKNLHVFQQLFLSMLLDWKVFKALLPKVSGRRGFQ
jgi:hypothetical protein